MKDAEIFNHQRDVSILIPLYRSTLSSYEKLSLTSVFNHFNNYFKVLVKPEGVDTSVIENEFNFDGVEVFDRSYFQSISAYNRLLLSAEFYGRFLNSRYVLICHADVFVFKDDLAYWLSKDYDYVAAPWISRSVVSLFFYRLRKFIGIRILNEKYRVYKLQTRYQVGNGGFSLRKVEVHYNLSSLMKEKIEYYLANQGQHCFNEDIFWSMEPRIERMKFSVPDYNEALKFAFDVNPDISLIMNNRELPMACHGWFKRKPLTFWRKIILKNTYLKGAS